MRELKFRVWFDGDDVEPVFYDSYSLFDDTWTADTPYCIEQYTGLEDKSGKEIYEGDIVEEKIDTGDYTVDGTYKYKVIWDDEMLCWSLAPNYTSIHKDLWECNQSLKVVGNIHGNPELVKEEE